MFGFMKSFFLLPPVEKRRDISRSWINPVFNGRMTKEHDDLYIYWRCYVISAVVCLSYVVLYQVNYFFNLGLPVQFVHDYDPVRNFSYSYSLMSIPLTLFIMGYGLLSLMLNLNLKTFDLTWYLPEERRQKLHKNERMGASMKMRIAFPLVLVSVPGWGWGSTIVLSYYESLAYSWEYQILIGFVLPGMQVIMYSVLPYITALYYQIRKGWFNPMITHPSNN